MDGYWDRVAKRGKDASPYRAGFAQIICVADTDHNGNMPDEKTRWSSKLFAKRVLPKLRDLGPEWKDDDRWWPKPMADRRRPEENLPAAVRRADAPVRRADAPVRA